MPTPIIFDCDPGLDDAIALAMALHSQELDIKAVTTSAGNQTPEKTLHNALGLLTLMQRTDIPVAGGAHQPLMRKLMIADHVHGETGMGTTKLPTATIQPHHLNAVELMAKILRESDTPITLVVTGPMTNAALLLSQYSELKSKISRIVFMGGGIDGGNATPAAEFNIIVDPEAAEIVLQSGVPLVMAGLNMTHQALVMADEVEQIRAINNPVAKAVAEMLDFYLPLYLSGPRKLSGAAMHDPCVVAWLLKPDLFTSAHYWVGVETQGKYTTGMTVADVYNLTGNAPNTEVLLNVDREGFVKLLMERVSLY
ncbi:pyrimidine-specific ribonucleoside hydrolase RihA [Hafnia alvei]|uniref:pyrimidine-specific ribonucleoside hydrolase RihA n=1 Tax=Hafnia alvei TaxID=569 RepID=UPI00103308DE|nr:pyrimidine-specific ribonucleoside hydrolase RihA [Hafnia alvei]KAA0264461.1 pyrimidine-specific ribonucleoside hydrolase RihA [Hafnia alvei]TBL89698.1 pyrimidine-specific ribonucleoside hydrolase RihA [Hafnia alvei]